MQVFPVAAEARRGGSMHERCFWESGRGEYWGDLKVLFVLTTAPEVWHSVQGNGQGPVPEREKERALCLLPWVILSGGPVAIRGSLRKAD